MSTAINENKVKEYIGKLLSMQSVKNSTYVSDELKSISGRLDDETFRIAVVGEFSSGK